VSSGVIHPRRARTGGCPASQLFRGWEEAAALRLGPPARSGATSSSAAALSPSFRSGKSIAVEGFKSPSPRVLGGLLVAIRLFRPLTRNRSAAQAHWAAASSAAWASSRQRFSRARRGGIPRFKASRCCPSGQKHLGRGALQHEFFAAIQSTNSLRPRDHQKSGHGWPHTIAVPACVDALEAEAIAFAQWPGLR